MVTSKITRKNLSSGGTAQKKLYKVRTPLKKIVKKTVKKTGASGNSSLLTNTRSSKVSRKTY